MGDGEGEPCLVSLHSPHLAGAGLSADTSLALPLGFYLWGQADQSASETRDQSPRQAGHTREEHYQPGLRQAREGIHSAMGCQGVEKAERGLRRWEVVLPAFTSCTPSLTTPWLFTTKPLSTEKD